MSQSNYHNHGHCIYSYQTVIYQRVSGGLTIGNVTLYSNTTSKHQSMAGARRCDVVLDNVPKGCSDLLDLAVRRDLIPLNTTFAIGTNLYRVTVKYNPEDDLALDAVRLSPCY